MYKVIKAFCRLLSNYASPFVIASAIVAFFVPVAFGWVHGNVSSVILGIIMLSMGLTISMNDVRNLMKQPFHILLGAVAQYTIMPFVAFGLTKVFGLDPYLAVGIILVFRMARFRNRLRRDLRQIVTTAEKISEMCKKLS